MFFKKLFLFVAVVYGLNASAQDFLDGWYFNPNQSGSGFNVNQQADITAIALFDFTTDGDTQWATAVDQITFNQNGDEVFEAPLTIPASGACFDCPYFPNSGNIGGDVLRVVFSGQPDANGNVTATVTLRGTTESYEMLLFRFADALDFMISTWTMTAFVDGADGVIIPVAEIIEFDSVGVGSDGVPFVAGQLLSRPDSVAVAQFAPSNLIEPGGLIDLGDLVILADNVGGVGVDQFWVFEAYKESLVGDTEAGDDPISTIQVSGGVDFTGHRLGNTINSNSAAVSPQSQTLAGRLVNSETKPATPRMVALADQLSAQLSDRLAASVAESAD